MRKLLLFVPCMTLLATFATVHAQADGPEGVISAQAEAFAMRVEYDIPLPVGTGTVAHVSGEARRSQAGENVKGVAGAPSELDAVVGGRYIDPQQTGHPVNRPPQTECFYPGNLLATSFAFPTDTRSETAAAPATSYAVAKCSAGPELELHAVDGATPTNPVLSAGSVAADALARPVDNLLTSTTEARATGVSVLGGLLKIGSVMARGHSETTGAQGGAKTSAEVVLSDIDVSGTRFSMTTGTNNGKDVSTVTAGNTTAPLDSPQGQGVLDSANALLRPQGCSLAVLTSPSSYPQGYVFARPEPDVGIKQDGSLAASYRGGLLLVCNIPRNLSDPTTVSPQRMQVLFGFAFTSTAANAEIGGFSFEDLDLGGDAGPIVGSAIDVPLTDTAPVVTSSPLDLPGVTSPITPRRRLPVPPVRPRSLPQPDLVVAPLSMDQGLRLFLGLLCVIVWGYLTNFGARRFLIATGDGDQR
jgi:hypothetical protein